MVQELSPKASSSSHTLWKVMWQICRSELSSTFEPRVAKLAVEQAGGNGRRLFWEPNVYSCITKSAVYSKM